ALVDLSEAMGVAGQNVAIDDQPWTKKAHEEKYPASRPETHPLAILKNTEIAVTNKQIVAIQREYRPRLWLHSGIWSRGSGSRINGHPVVDGILPQNANYIAGFSIDFPVLSYFADKYRAEIARQEVVEETASFDLAIQQLIQKDGRARVLLKNARRLADETPVMVKAARENETKALERYRVGLTNVLEVAEAQRILQAAVVRDANAQVNIWRAILAVSYARGNLDPFVQAVHRAESEK
ncbi:MAG TPA: TolC family protein, partial [Chroococcales cyanobacterium]